MPSILTIITRLHFAEQRSLYLPDRFGVTGFTCSGGHSAHAQFTQRFFWTGTQPMHVNDTTQHLVQRNVVFVGTPLSNRRHLLNSITTPFTIISIISITITVTFCIYLFYAHHTVLLYNAFYVDAMYKV